MNSLFDTQSIVQNAFQAVPLFQQEQQAAQAQEAAVRSQGDALARMAKLPALEEPKVFGQNRKADMAALIASAVAAAFDKSGQASKAIADGYIQGRLLDVDRQSKNNQLRRGQETQSIKAEYDQAGLTADLAGKKRADARGERIRLEDRNAKLADKQRQDNLIAEQKAEIDLDRAQGRYNSASTFDEKIQAGKNLQRLQRGRGIEPMTDDEIAAAAAAIKSGRLDNAQKAARAVFENHVKAYGYVDEETAQQMESQIGAIAKDWQVDRNTLPQVPTIESLAKEKQDFWKKDVDRRFRHLQETDRKKLAQSFARVQIAQDSLKLAAQRLDVSRDMVTIGAYNAATARFRSEIAAAKGEMETLESGDMGKLAQKIALKKAALSAAIENEDEEKEVELRAELGVYESELDAMQTKVLQGMGVDPDPANILGTAGKIIGAATQRSAASKSQAGPGPAVNQNAGASSKLLTTKDGKTFSVQDAYNAAKRAIAANPANRAAIIARYESLPGKPKWPG